MTYRQEAPFAVQIELTEGCNLRCPFCGLNGIREPKNHNFKFMEPRTLALLMDQIVKAKWNPRIEFAMHGEPTMHPKYAEMIGVARTYAPKLQLMMTSNGGGLLKPPGALANIKELFKQGLNVLALDDYEGIKICTKIMELIAGATFDEVTDWLGDIDLYQYPMERAGNPHARRRIKDKVLILIKDISRAQSGTHSTLNNHAGAGAPKNDSEAGSRCAKPFRELSVRWNGNVAICCNDWRGEYKCGSVLEDGLLEVWHGDAMNSARRMLYHGRREFGPCMGCDARSHRVGLLPDKLGKRTLPKPSALDQSNIEKALRGRPYTAPVLRPWELKK